MTKQATQNIERPPVVVVMGHVDHGKSALLDYIRNTNIVANEAGGITQHINAYEITHEYEGENKKITFIDTPGHAAFSAMRSRGASVADIAILVVSAEDGVKAQTLEALNAIKSAKIPYIVAINKIDLPSANLVSTQTSLIEHEIYIEGMGGDIPWVAISAKTGEGINDLLDTLLLVAQLEDLHADSSKLASGVVIEVKQDNKRGIAATLIIKDGSIQTGEYVVSGNAMAPTRIMEDFTGSKIQSATFSSPLSIVGFNNPPKVGATFKTYTSKKDATLASSIKNKESANKNRYINESEQDKFIMPIIIKADTNGSVEAIIYELQKLETEHAGIFILDSGIGSVSESDVKTALATPGAVIIGFNVQTDATAKEAARQNNIKIKSFNIIYELAQWLSKHIESVRPKVETQREVGSAKVLAIFSETKTLKTVGGRVLVGQMRVQTQVHIYSHNNELKGTGKVITLQSGKASVETVNKEQEFGAQIETEIVIEKGDRISCVETILE